MQTIVLPASTCEPIETKLRNFVWGGYREGEKNSPRGMRSHLCAKREWGPRLKTFQTHQ
ncbi:hypothetical protein LINPERHAP1_LOCUS17066 [Linum perenne]